MKRFSSALGLVVAVFIFTLFTTPSAFAQSTSSLFPTVNSDVPQDQNTFIQSIFLNTFSFLNCQLVGSDFSQNSCLGFDQGTKKIGYVKNSGGVLGVITNGISSTYAIDIHLRDYTSHVAQNFGFSHAYAANTGSQQLAPFFSAWQNMRNLTYIFFVVAFIIVGISIMLRVKMDPRTVISIQSQLPRIVIALLLISFSYAISGFLVDMMYVATYSTFPLMANSGLINTDNLGSLTSAQNGMNTENPLQFFNRMEPIPKLGFDVLGSVKDIFTGTLTDSAPGGIPGVTGIINLIKLGIAALLISLAAGLFTIPFLYFILIAILLWALLKVWFNLIKSFVVVIVDTIVAPLWIFLGVLPGSKVNFETWLRHLAGYLTVFPATVLFFLFAKGLQDTLGRNDTNFSLPIIGSGYGPNTMSSLVVYCLVLLAPKLQDWILAIFKAPSGGTIAAAITGGFNEGRQKFDKGLVQPTKGFAQSTLFHGPRLVVPGSATPKPGETQGALRSPLVNTVTHFSNYMNEDRTDAAGNIIGRNSRIQRVYGSLGVNLINRIAGDKARLSEDKRQ